MYQLRADTGRDLVYQASLDVLDGDPVSPRGMKTYELTSAKLQLDNPRDALPTGINRVGLQPSIGAIEALQLVGGVSVPQLLQRLAPAFGRFVNEEGDYDGAYGPRVGRQMDDIAERLMHDEDSRQCVVSIWNETDLRRVNSRDYPCTLTLHFMVRDHRLQLHTTMRSNDVWLGLPYDMFMFTQLQCTLAHVLGYDVGPYIHEAHSLHLYERNVEQVEALVPPFARVDLQARGELISLDGIDGGGTGITGWVEAQHRARLIMKGVAKEQARPSLTQSESWYLEQIEHRTNGWLL